MWRPVSPVSPATNQYLTGRGRPRRSEMPQTRYAEQAPEQVDPIYVGGDLHRAHGRMPVRMGRGRSGSNRIPASASTRVGAAFGPSALPRPFVMRQESPRTNEAIRRALNYRRGAGAHPGTLEAGVKARGGAASVRV
jgi:hypothetical protein